MPFGESLAVLFTGLAAGAVAAIAFAIVDLAMGVPIDGSRGSRSAFYVAWAGGSIARSVHTGHKPGLFAAPSLPMFGLALLIVWWY
jgi:hypothetical protein